MSALLFHVFHASAGCVQASRRAAPGDVLHRYPTIDTRTGYTVYYITAACGCPTCRKGNDMLILADSACSTMR